eukprot:193116-Rhodomonas_salina.6
MSERLRVDNSTRNALAVRNNSTLMLSIVHRTIPLTNCDSFLSYAPPYATSVPGIPYRRPRTPYRRSRQIGELTRRSTNCR